MAEIKVAALVGVMTAMAGLLVFSSPARCDTGIVAASFKELDDGEKSRSAKHRWIRLFVRVFFVYVVFATFAGLESVIRRSSMVFTAKPAAGQARRWSHEEATRRVVQQHMATRGRSALEKASVKMPTKEAAETTSFSSESEDVKARARRAAARERRRKENAFQRDADT
ncbi:expressed unknown protein [Ectocarpus siliculosus]|uniref:Transmembrane protein n=1 Tax=Ectocarpus siliculosus TaxID=2880 RepID=D7FXR5_ECTSI|nr:expressed unknown protein [Ectocarpus siliculosus]|eukprot:CBJ32328.1 expressed unknown protein [Ectocarpus siliculosus]